ncbi:hypothetical protein C4577_03020 [Candidatus Parcubacteria bacterium]|nr:MAG: hypothetical protein C4577_03020 [Candidatus Parcubacteria bacterium]
MIVQLTLNGWNPEGTADHLIKWVNAPSFDAAKKYAAKVGWDVVDIDDYPTRKDYVLTKEDGVDVRVDDEGNPFTESFDMYMCYNCQSRHLFFPYGGHCTNCGGDVQDKFIVEQWYDRGFEQWYGHKPENKVKEHDPIDDVYRSLTLVKSLDDIPPCSHYAIVTLGKYGVVDYWITTEIEDWKKQIEQLHVHNCVFKAFEVSKVAKISSSVKIDM